VGFRFCRTKLFGSLAVPLHSDFDEVNFRFYVRRKEGDENRRGVVFIVEIVPKQAVATTARLIYGENYVCLPMKHHICAEGSKKSAKYQWQVKNQWCQLTAQAIGAPELPREASLEQFITEHYWAIRLNEAEHQSNITFLVYLGKCGRALRQDLKVMQAGCTGSN
jgi:uncharacterized protein YqjF (DUF2071 family)